MRPVALLAASSLLAACASDPAPPRSGPRVATVDGIPVVYESEGTGPAAVVFVHGWTCDRGSWRDQLPSLRGHVRTIALDLPGHGQSGKPEVAYTMELFARAVDAVMRDAGVKRAVLVGHSMGTPVIREFYRRHPEQTAGLVAVDGMLVMVLSPKQREAFLKRVDEPLPEEARRAALASFFNDATPKDRRAALEATCLACPHYVAESAVRGMLDPAIWTDDPIRVPTLVVVAKASMWNEEYEKSVRRLASDVDYRVMDGASHFLMVDRPAEFNAMLFEFVEQCLPSS